MDDSYVPRYVTIERHLRSRIASMQPGEKLPSDAELCEEFGVSRMTARHAVQSLVQDGLVSRMPGRGSFVMRPPVRRQMGSLLSFTEEMRRRGLAASSRLLSQGLEQPSETEASQLRISPGDRAVVVCRLRLANGTPMSIERVVLPPGLEAVLDEDLETGSLHAAMIRGGCVPALARGTLTVRLSTSKEATLLEIGRRQPVMVEQRLIHDQHDRPVELTESRYAGQRYVFDIELHADVVPAGDHTGEATP